MHIYKNIKKLVQMHRDSIVSRTLYLYIFCITVVFVREKENNCCDDDGDGGFDEI